MKKNSSIMLTADDGSEEAFFVWEKAEIAGREYLLVTDKEPPEEDENGTGQQEESGDEEEPAALILRVNEAQSGDGEILYDVVEDKEELQIIAKYFEELLEDVNIFL